MKAQQSNTSYGSVHWWVKSLHRVTGPTHPNNCREDSHKEDDFIPWAKDKTMIVATVYHTDNWPFTQNWVLRAVAHWCQQHCRGKWFIGELDHLYFENEDDALSFRLIHGRPY